MTPPRRRPLKVRVTDAIHPLRDAVRGAVRWMARSAALSSTERAGALRTLLSSTTPDAVRQTTRILETAAAMDDAVALVADHPAAR